MSTYRVEGPSSFGVVGRVLPREDEACRSAVSRAKSRWRRWAVAVAVGLAALAAWQFGSAAVIQAKAALAQHLIAASWASALKGEPRAPWPRADTRPVARLTVPSRGIELFILAGTSGRSLAFGPGHVDGTAMPGGAGNSVIVAHRDTHFAFLRDLHADDVIAVEDLKGRVTRYRVRERAVVSRDETRLLDPAGSPQLTLITCWPFDAVAPGTTLRYVVIADRFA